MSHVHIKTKATARGGHYVSLRYNGKTEGKTYKTDASAHAAVTKLLRKWLKAVELVTVQSGRKSSTYTLRDGKVVMTYAGEFEGPARPPTAKTVAKRAKKAARKAKSAGKSAAAKAAKASGTKGKLPAKVKAGGERFRAFMETEKKAGKTHKAALAAWRASKGTKAAGKAKGSKAKAAKAAKAAGAKAGHALPAKAKAGAERYRAFLEAEKKAGKSYKAAVATWRATKGTKTKGIKAKAKAKAKAGHKAAGHRHTGATAIPSATAATASARLRKHHRKGHRAKPHRKGHRAKSARKAHKRHRR